MRQKVAELKAESSNGSLSRKASRTDNRVKTPIEYGFEEERYALPPPPTYTSRLEPLPTLPFDRVEDQGTPTPEYTPHTPPDAGRQEPLPVQDYPPPGHLPLEEWGADIEAVHADIRRQLAELRAPIVAFNEDEYGPGYYGDHEPDDDEDQEMPPIDYEEEPEEEDPEEDPNPEFEEDPNLEWEEDPEEDPNIEEEEYSSCVTDVGSD